LKTLFLLLFILLERLFNLLKLFFFPPTSSYSSLFFTFFYSFLQHQHLSFKSYGTTTASELSVGGLSEPNSPATPHGRPVAASPELAEKNEAQRPYSQADQVFTLFFLFLF